MSRDNDVFQILVTKGNKAVLGPNLKVDALTDGQIGVFDANTNMSVDGTTAVKEIYLAVGVADASGLKSIVTSAGVGGAIQTRNINAYTFRPHTAGRPQIVEVSDFIAKCDTEYALKIAFDNARIMRNNYPNNLTRYYNVKTDCCVDCEDKCNSYDCNRLIKALVEKVNQDPNGLVTAEAWDATANSGAGGVVTDIDAFIATNETVNNDTDVANDVCLKIRLTSKAFDAGHEMIGGVNLGYYPQKETTMQVSFAAGFGCGGKIETIQTAVYEEGTGTDVQQREYKANGWETPSSTYRTSAVTGFPTGAKFFADPNAKYDKVVLEYQHEAQGGWLDYKNELATEIAIPTTDNLTRGGLITILDRFAAKVNLDALTDDSALANADVTVVEPTEEIDDVTKDGLA